MRVRAEQPEDQAQIREIHQRSFPTGAEAKLVDRLRASDCTYLSLVAEMGGHLVGHLLITPVSLPVAPSTLDIAAIAPMAVLPEYQRQGVGSALLQAALQKASDEGVDALCVLGDHHFYQRFNFVPASQFQIRCEYPVPDEAFMLIELNPGSLKGNSGKVRYQDAFNQL